MKKTILLSLALVAFLGLPGLAAADTPSAPAVPAQGCNDLGFLAAAPAASTATSPADLNPLAGVIEVQGGGCCTAKQRQCQNNCACGVFEFNCDPATCQSSCICNICP